MLSRKSCIKVPFSVINTAQYVLLLEAQSFFLCREFIGAFSQISCRLSGANHNVYICQQ